MSEQGTWLRTLRRRVGRMVYGPDDERVHEVWVEQSVGDDWIAAARVAAQDGRPVIAELRVFPGRLPGAGAEKRAAGRWSKDFSLVPDGGLKQRGGLRDVRLDFVAKHFETLLARIEEGGERAEMLTALASYAGAQPEWRHRKQPGGLRPITDLDLAKVARDYLAFVKESSRAPVKRLAHEERLSEAAIRERLKRAREKGILESSGRGVAGGRLTAKATKILEDAGEETETDG